MCILLKISDNHCNYLELRPTNNFRRKENLSLTLLRTASHGDNKTNSAF
jgi:hypothetical protein